MPTWTPHNQLRGLVCIEESAAVMPKTKGRQLGEVYSFTPRIASTLKNDGSAALAHVLAQTDGCQAGQVYASVPSSTNTLQCQRALAEATPFVDNFSIAHLDHFQRGRVLDLTR